MAENSRQLGEKLAGYLHSLPAHTLVQLVHELDGTTVTEDLDPANALILDAARATLESYGDWGGVVGYPERMAFADAEPFRVPVHTQQKHRARIADDSLHNIWVALLRADGGAEFARDIRDLASVIADDPQMLEKLVAGNRGDIVERLRQLYSEIVSDDSTEHRATARLGGLRSVEDLADLITVTTMGEKLDRFKRTISRLLGPVVHLDRKAEATVSDSLEPYSGEELVYPLVVLLGRMDNPGSLLNLLLMSEETDDPGRLAKTRFAPVVDVLLNELDILAMIVEENIRAGDIQNGVLPAVRRFHEIASSLTLGIDMEQTSDWSRRLTGKRRRIADTLRAPLEKTVAALRLGIQPNGPGVVMPDSIDVEEAIASAQLLMAIKPLRAELALNECVSRVHTATETFFDTAARNLPQQARHAAEADMPALNARFDALYRTAEVLFGEEYAALLRRSGEVAGLCLSDDTAPKAA